MASECATSEEFGEWWEVLSEEEQESVDAGVELLEGCGPNLPFPYSSGIKGSKYSRMRELRIQCAGDPYRVLYIFAPRIKQPNVAKMEKRTDSYISTLRATIEAMGGTLEIVVSFPESKVKIKNFSSIGEGEAQEAKD